MSFGYSVLGFGAHTSGSTLTDGLVSWWSLDETSGTRVDSHGSNDLTDNNTVTYVAGKQGNAAEFTKANLEYLNVAATHGLHGGDRDFTCAGWAYVRNGSGLQGICGTGSSTAGAASSDWWVGISSSKFIFYGEVGTTHKPLTANTFGAISADTFYFFVAEYNATTDTLGLSVNNGTVDTLGSVTALNNTGNDFNVGLGFSNIAYLNGGADEIAFWSRLLTADEKTELYNSGSGIGYPG